MLDPEFITRSMTHKNKHQNTRRGGCQDQNKDNICPQWVVQLARQELMRSGSKNLINIFGPNAIAATTIPLYYVWKHKNNNNRGTIDGVPRN